MATQVTQRKYYPCRTCSTQIFFDINHKSQSGKFIPLELDAVGQIQKHSCLNRQRQQQQQQQQPEVIELLQQVLKRLDEIERLVKK